MAAFDEPFTDDEEDVCPLCIEEMDISDKNFKPCPCGFQICQFCYNNIRSNPDLNNRCPACRRTYDDESIEYKTFTAEDVKREQERKQRKELERKQREREKNKDHHEPRNGDQRNLAGMRVIQKNLVYVIGLNPNIPADELQQMLRRDEFFGQYGKIQKIVINKRVSGNGNPGIGVYVTFARKEDAARCIAAVDGSINDGKYLRAAYGTTKYCSSYLRGQNCPNPNCMFLHEPGEEADSVNRHNKEHTHSQTSGPAAATSHSTHTQGNSSTNNSVPHPAGGSSASHHVPPGATLTAAHTPALPAWGKTVPQIPSVQKLTAPELPNSAEDALRVLSLNLESLAATNWDLQFVSDIVSEDTRFPSLFNLPLDDKKRLKVYNRAMADLDKIKPPSVEVTPEPTEPAISRQVSQAASDTFSGSESTDNESRSSEKKNNNSQQLLAHLMRDQQQSRPEDVRKQILPSKVTSELMAILDKSGAGRGGDLLQGVVGETLRSVASELLQPAKPVSVEVDDTVEFDKSNLEDNGPYFDLTDIPTEKLVGDVEPSVWAAIEQRTSLLDLQQRREKEFSAAKAQTKKRMKRLRV